MTNPYPVEILGDDEDDGTMPDSLAALTEAVVGRRVVSAERVRVERSYYSSNAFQITLDDGRKVQLVENGDCCAYTELESFLLNADKVEHVITGVGTTDGYTKWHIYADFGDIMELTVGWSCGNPFYYGYGFDIKVEEAK